MQRPLVISNERNWAGLAALMTSSGAIQFNLETDASSLPKDISVVIVDLPLSETEVIKRLAVLLNRLPKEARKLFVIDKAHRVEIVRATVLGATAMANSPLSHEDLEIFLRHDEGIIFERGSAVGGSSVAQASALLADVVKNVVTGGGLSYDDVATACDSIAATLHSDGLENWLETVRSHHQGTLQHCLIVAGVMTRFGQRLGMSDNDVRMLTRIGLLHDVGKAYIPTQILDKPAALTADEFKLIKTHPYRSFKFLSAHQTLNIEELAAVVGHHEYLDGSGYPYGLMDRSIGDLVRITTVCDVYGALIERRSYKREMSPADALAIVSRMANEGKMEISLVRALRRSLD